MYILNTATSTYCDMVYTFVQGASLHIASRRRKSDRILRQVELVVYILHWSGSVETTNTIYIRLNRSEVQLRGRASARGAISRSNQCSMNGATKVVVCAVLCLGWCM